LQRVLLEHRPFTEQIELLRRARARDPLLEEPAEIIPPVGVAQQLVERVERHLVRRVLLDELFVARHRLVDLPFTRLDLRDLRAQGALLFAPPPLRLELRLERLDVPPPRARLLRRLLEARERPRRVPLPARRQLVGATRVRERRRAILELVPGDVGEL